MRKQFLSLLSLGFLFYCCSSAGQVQSDTATPEPDYSGTTAAQTVAAWYDHSGKAYSDSLKFTGLGMALAADSSEALEVSIAQARENLEYAVDSYAENYRRQLTESEDGNELSSPGFLLSLRRAINNLQFSDSDLTFTSEYSARDNGSVIAYSMVSYPKDLALDMLASTIENDTFSRLLRDSFEK